MADCRTCKRTDVKCCPTCGRGDDCNVYHRCGEDCIGHKSMTNADRIRSMSDEELAEWIAEIHACVSDDKICYLGKTCEVCTLEWLKQEMGCE